MVTLRAKPSGHVHGETIAFGFCDDHGREYQTAGYEPVEGEEQGGQLELDA